MTRPKPIPAAPQIAPSLLSADFARLGEEIASLHGTGVEMLHLDVMDGHFVPNITFGPPLVRSVRGMTPLFLDTHLMIDDPLAYVDAFIESGADLLTLHAESLGSAAHASYERAREARRRTAAGGCGLGLSFRPASDPWPWIEALGAELDLVLLMTVDPGFGGQPFMEDQLPKFSALRALRDRRGWAFRIEVDGGINPRTAAQCARAGAEVFVAGTAVFGRPDHAAAFRELHAAVQDPGSTAGRNAPNS